MPGIAHKNPFYSKHFIIKGMHTYKRGFIKTVSNKSASGISVVAFFYTNHTLLIFLIRKICFSTRGRLINNKR